MGVHRGTILVAPCREAQRVPCLEPRRQILAAVTHPCSLEGERVTPPILPVTHHAGFVAVMRSGKTGPLGARSCLHLR